MQQTQLEWSLAADLGVRRTNVGRWIRSRRTWPVIAVGLLWVGCSAHATRVEYPPNAGSNTLGAALPDFHEGPVALRFGDPGALLVPEGCRVRCAGSSFAQVECHNTLLEARSPAVLWPKPQNEERLANGGVVQWAQYGDDFMGVLVASGGHFALVQKRSTVVGRSDILQLLRSYHTASTEHSQVNCPMVLY
jgi:hypothetical protein